MKYYYEIIFFKSCLDTYSILCSFSNQKILCTFTIVGHVAHVNTILWPHFICNNTHPLIFNKNVWHLKTTQICFGPFLAFWKFPLIFNSVHSDCGLMFKNAILKTPKTFIRFSYFLFPYKEGSKLLRIIF